MAHTTSTQRYQRAEAYDQAGHAVPNHASPRSTMWIGDHSPDYSLGSFPKLKKLGEIPVAV